MRMVGPDCLGVASPRPEIALKATVAPIAPRPGEIGFASQSGGFGIAAIDEAAARGIGFSSFVSMGDKADLSGNDFMEYWEQDPDRAVAELDLDPVIATPDGALVVDARVRLEAPGPAAAFPSVNG
jgi:acyl-CoA synthetase (NDP forming)